MRVKGSDRYITYECDRQGVKCVHCILHIVFFFPFVVFLKQVYRMYSTAQYSTGQRIEDRIE